MWKIALTGSIGSGKTLVASLFEQMGIPVYHADDEAKRIYQYPYVIDKVTDRFGPGILDESGMIDKGKLAGVVFADQAHLQWINQLIHPMVKADFGCWCDLHHGFPFVIQEAAILFESGFDKYFDRIILVTAPQALRLERVMQRDKIAADPILRRMAYQWDDERKTAKSDFIINNDGNHLLLPRVDDIRQTLLSLC